jgi:outer membrane protein
MSGRTMSRIARWALIAAPVVLPISVGGAQVDTGLTLREVVRQTLASNPDLLYAGATVSSSRGALLAARGQFDAQIQTSVGGNRQSTAVGTGIATDPLIWLSTNQTTYGVTLQKQFRSGIVAGPSIDLQRSNIIASGAAPTAQGSTHFRVLVPVGKDRGGSMTAATERAAERGLTGSELTETHTASLSVVTAVSVYWGYRAARDRLVVYRESEARAERMVVETQVLVDAEERTASDLKQLKANLAAKRVARLNAEQALEEAAQQVALAMGVPSDKIAALPRPSTEFPALSADTPTTATVAGWQRVAVERRADRAAAGANSQAAEIGRRAARADLAPRIDVVLDLGYSGYAQGVGAGGLFSPLYRTVPGMNTSVELRYQLPATNIGAKGRLAQADAYAEQQRLILHDTERHIASDVALAATALGNSRLELIESRSAVDLWATSVQSEQRKFKLGVSTIFDIIQSQDAHTNARLGEIASAYGYAVALARVRFATGTLLRHEGAGVTVEWTDLLTAP